jgi:preprotein translocase subunit SecE
MALQVYKSGQGYWTRMMTAIAVMTFTLGFAVWFNDKLLFKFMDNEKNEMYWQAGIIAVTAVAVGALLWWLLNKPKIADFMIATENEMKKVNWPTKQAVMGLTWIVIAGTLMIAAILFVADFGFTNVATWIGILESAETP